MKTPSLPFLHLPFGLALAPHTGTFLTARFATAAALLALFYAASRRSRRA